jgi:transposase-like protein
MEMLSTVELEQFVPPDDKVVVQDDFSRHLKSWRGGSQTSRCRRFKNNWESLVAHRTYPKVGSQDRDLLYTWARSRTLATRLVQRSRIVLLLADGKRVTEVARSLGISETTVRLWRTRFLAHGPQGLLNDAPGRGRKPVLPQSARDALRVRHSESDVVTVRQQARELGVSPATVSRWRRRKIKDS